MELDDQDKTMRIKQEKCDDIDYMVEDIDIKENSIEVSCDGIKSEEIKINDPGASGSATSTFEFVGIEDNKETTQTAKIEIKTEYPDADTGQPIEELGTNSTSDTKAHATCYSVWHRIKEQPTADGCGEVKMEQAEMDIKYEKLESEIASSKFEDTASLELNKLLDSETKINPTVLSAELDGIKEEPTADGCGEVKMEQAEIDIKYEKLESEIASSKFEDTASLELNKLLDSETKINPTVLSAELDGTAKDNILRQGDHVRESSEEKQSVSCYDCNYTAYHKDDLTEHMKIHENRKKLIKHTRTNYSINSRNCMYCKAKFRTTQHMDMHVLRKHPEFVASIKSQIH